MLPRRLPTARSFQLYLYSRWPVRSQQLVFAASSLILNFALCILNLSAAIPAFPGAEGAGASTPGGRGGRIFEVTHLADSGPGSLREAVEAEGPRIVVFRVSGIITLEKPLAISNPYITIAGQTAPGDGICIRGQTTEINTHDVVLRYLRFRRGSISDRDDALGGYPVGNIIVDHCSASWGLDENLSLYRYMKTMPDGPDKKMPVENLTIQWCISSEALDLNNHAFGATWGGKNCSFHHNLFACNTGRNPSIGWGDHFDFRNNVLFNWRHRTVDGGDASSMVNIVANYYKPGPATNTGAVRYRVCKPQHLSMYSEAQRDGKWYVADNFVAGYPQVAADNWDGGVQFDQEDARTEAEVKALIRKIRATRPIAAPPITGQSAEQAYELVLDSAGATLPKRDPIDARIINTVRTGKPTYGNGIINTPSDVGGWPEYKSTPAPADSDHDGMPDAWEKKFGLNGNDPSDGPKDADDDGYTNVEEWFNGTDPTQFVDYRNPGNNPGAPGSGQMSAAASPALAGAEFVEMKKQRVIILTDISNEPDDEQSLVRFLVYSNGYDVEGMIATTSVWLKDKVRPDKIQEAVLAYGRVRDNLLKHAPRYPTKEHLLNVIKAGRAEFGMDGVGQGKSSEGSRHIIAALDKPDKRPVWLCVWGGANCLAQALWEVKYTRSPEELDAFVSKLCVYTISDQDNSGRWMRITFPNLFYIVSTSSVDNQEYHKATWTGISGDRFYQNGPMHKFELVDNPWLEKNIIAYHGPLGVLYPKLKYIMEGDTPSFFALINNGLASHISPSYGGWGGRYALHQTYGETRPIWTNTRGSRDTVMAENGTICTSDQATIWRWREAYQRDFAARMDWCVADTFEKANHNPVAVFQGDKSKALAKMRATSGERVNLSAAGTYDPDGDRVSYHWFVYNEPGTFKGAVEIENSTSAEAYFVAPQAGPEPGRRMEEPKLLHIILEVKDDGQPCLYSYRRIIITIEGK